MTEKEASIYLDDISGAIEKILEYTSSMNEIQFSQDILTQDAVIRRFAIIGEAAGKIPEDLRKKFPLVPWKSIVGLRNVIIHEYAGVSMNRVWEVIKNELIPLQKTISDMRKMLL